ncbi:MAG: carboxypeptidase-like regulatory domain-containing protein [Proteobacteria bacterium]|nr:carboxypeptidase-like regulatory domain-containing protein [Pseudomonadota bacterium]
MAIDKNPSNLNDSSNNQEVCDERLESTQLELYKEFIDFQNVGQILFQWEAQRLGKQLGADHPRVKVFNERVKQKATFLADIEVELEFANIKIPEVTESGGLIHGRVFDENKRGIEKLNVRLEDENGQKLGFAGQPKTDASGYYTFEFDSKKLEKLEKLGEVYLVLVNPAGKIVYRESKALKLAAGNSTVINVTLNRADLHPISKKVR